MKRATILIGGFAATLGVGALWHGPLGAGERFAAKVEHAARATLDSYEMTSVEARLQRHPLQRRLLLSGPADDFQRREIVRLLETIPGVSEARWTAGGTVR